MQHINGQLNKKTFLRVFTTLQTPSLSEFYPKSSYIPFQMLRVWVRHPCHIVFYKIDIFFKYKLKYIKVGWAGTRTHNLYDTLFTFQFSNIICSFLLSQKNWVWVFATVKQRQYCSYSAIAKPNGKKICNCFVGLALGIDYY